MSSPEDTVDTVDNADETDVEAPAVDSGRDALVATLAATLGDGFVAGEVDPGVDVCVRVTADSWLAAGIALRDHCGMSYFGFLSAIDWLPSPYGRDMDAQVDGPEASDPEPMEWGTTGGETRFQLLARVHDPMSGLGITVKADVPGDRPEVDSWIPAYAGADWHEREAWEMFGISFRGHPNQVHLYLPGAFEGNPLRKDYPLLARRIKPWPGIVDVELMPGSDDEAGDDEAPEESEAGADA